MKLLGKAKIVAIVFYVVAALYLFYTIFATVSTIQYISSIASSGMYAAITMSDIISAFVGQVGPYLFYTFATFSLGYLIQMGGALLQKSGYKDEEEVPDYEAKTDLNTMATPPVSDSHTFSLNEDNQEPMTIDIENVEEEEKVPAETEDEVIVAESEPEVEEEVKELEEDVAEALDDTAIEIEIEDIEEIEEEDEE